MLVTFADSSGADTAYAVTGIEAAVPPTILKGILPQYEPAFFGLNFTYNVKLKEDFTFDRVNDSVYTPSFVKEKENPPRGPIVTVEEVAPPLPLTVNAFGTLILFTHSVSKLVTTEEYNPGNEFAALVLDNSTIEKRTFCVLPEVLRI